MNNFLTAIAVILVVILSALFAVPMMVDWDDYRSDFETRLTEILGTRVELDGSLNVRLLPTPYVRAENLRLGESGVEGRPILEVDELTLWVGIPPLLKGIVEASTLTLERPRLLLQFDKEGRPTFDAKRARESGKAPLDNLNGPGSDTSGVIISGLKLSPNLISLKNVRVNNGEVILQSPLIEGTDLRRVAFSGVAGVLSATTLSGPIYFNGRYGSEEDPSFVRLAVGKSVRGGIYPVRAKLTVPQVDHRYEFDGTLVDEKGRWQAKGALKATLGRFGNLGRRGVISADEIAPLVETRPDEDLDEEEREAAKLKKQQALARKARLTNAEQEIILTSQVVVKGAEAQFRKLLLRGGSLAQPQIVRGQLSINWRDKLSLKGRANGQVIDLNMIYGLQPNGKIDRITPAAALSNLNDLLLSQTAIFETIDFKAKANQINVGEGVVRDFQLMLKSDGERIEVKTFDAALPGSSRISVAGDFTQSEIAPGFQGDIYLRGLQFAEFIRWAAPTLKLDFNEEEEQSFGRGKFILSGGVQMDEEAIALTGMQGDIAGSALRGEFQHKYARRGGTEARRGETLLKLRAGVLNVSDVIGHPVEVLNYEKGLTEFLNVAGLGATPKEENAGKSDVVTFDFAAQRLVFTDGEQRDVKLTWQADDQGGRIVALAGLSEHGLSIIFDKGGPGEPGAAALTDVSEQPVRRFIVEANESSAVQDLLRWSGVFNSVEFDERTLRRFLPLRLAVHREEGEGVKNYRVDGVIGGNDAAFTVSVPDKSNADNDLPITLLGGLESPNGAALAAQLMPFGIAEVVPSQKAEAELDSEIDFGPARLTFSASGTAEEGFNGQFALSNEQISLIYNGGLSVQGNKLVSKGLVQLESENTENIVQLFGLPPLADEEIQPFRGEVQLEQKLDGFAFNELKIAVGGLQIRGTGTFDVRDGERIYRLALATESVDVRTLLAPLQKNTGLSHRQGGSADEVWSDVPFKTGRELGQGDGNGVAEIPVNAVRGEIVVQANELLISDQMSLTDANVQWRFSDDVIEIVRVEGKSLGGVFAASGTLRQDGDSYSLNGLAALVNGKLEEIGAAQEASLGTGVFSVNISLSGRGQSVRSLVGNLVGEGAVKIQDGQIRQLSPTLLYGVASKFLNAEGGDIRVVDDQLQQAIDQGGSLKVGTIDLGLELLDGTIRLNQPDLGIQPGTVGVEGQLKLEDLSWSGVWTIKPAEVNEASIPAIKRRMEGRLAAQQSFKSKLEAAEFERYLGLKQKEEELRRLEQARLEAEQRRLEEERRQKEEELRRLELERKRIEEEQRRLDEEINRSPLPPLFPE